MARKYSSRRVVSVNATSVGMHPNVDDTPIHAGFIQPGMIVFDTVYKEGEYLLRPGPGQGGSQVLDLQPAQGGFVEFTFDEDGLYLIVTHKFSNVGKGALGIFAVGDVDTGDVAH